MNRTEEKIKAKELLSHLKSIESDLLFIHYSCEGFNNQTNKHPQVVTIAVKSYSTGMVNYFSIFQLASDLGISLTSISSAQLENIELELLRRFNSFVNSNAHKHWVHWQMIDAKYGFEALANRYKALNKRGHIKRIKSVRKTNLADVVKFKYTDDYEMREPNESRLINLGKRNKLNLNDCLPGTEEAVAYNNNQFQLIERSTIAKVRLLEDLYSKLKKDKLIVATSWYKKTDWDVKGYNPFSLKGIIGLAGIALVALFIFILQSLGERYVQNLVPELPFEKSNDIIDTLGDSRIQNASADTTPLLVEKVLGETSEQVDSFELNSTTEERNIQNEQTERFFNGDVIISTKGITFEGNPLRHFVDGIINSPNGKSVSFSKKDNGFTFKYKTQYLYQVTITEIKTFSAKFQVTKIQ